MRLLIGILSTLTIIFATESMAQKSVEKIVVSSSKSDKVIEEDLLMLKVYFTENSTIQELQKRYHFKIEMEKLEAYKMVVIKPIDSIDVRNKLQVFLAPLFEDIFYIEYIQQAEKATPIQKATSHVSTPKEKPSVHHAKKEKSFFDDIGLQWMLIWILAIVGLVLSIRNRRKLSDLEETQDDLKTKQDEIESEIQTLGEKNA